MFAVFVTFDVKPEYVEAFLPRMQQQAADSLKLEPACQIFEVWISSENANRVQLYEVYDDSLAFQAHLASDHFKDFDATVGPMIADKTVLMFDQHLQT